MTNQEAIEQIQERIDFCEKHFAGVVPEYREALVIAVNALKEKQAKKNHRRGMMNYSVC